MFNRFRSAFFKVIALVLVAAFVFSFVGCKKYSDPDERLTYVIEENLIDEINDALDKSLKEFDTAKKDSSAVKLSIKPTLSSACLALLASAPVDLSVINDAEIVLDTKVSKGMYELGLGLNYKTNALISAIAYVDTVAQKIFVSVPDLFEKSLELDLNELAGEDLVQINGSGSASSSLTSLDLEASEELLKTVKSILNRYLDVILSSLKGVTEEKVELEVEGVRSSATRLTLKLTQKQIVDIARELARTAKNDTELKDFIFENADLSDYTKEEFIAEMDESLDEFINTPDSELVVDDGVALELSLDVNSDDEIIGLVINAFDGDDPVLTLSFASVKTKDAFAVDFSTVIDGEAVSLTGKGETVKGISNGEFVLSIDNEEYIIFTVTDFDENANKKGYPNLKGELSFGKGLTKGEGAAIGMFSFGFEIKSTEKTADLLLNVNMNNAPFVSLDISAETDNKATVTLPTDTVSDPMTFVSGMDINGFAQKIKNSELPEDIKALFDALLSELN